MSTTEERRSDLEHRIRGQLALITDPCSVRNKTPLSLLEMGIIEDIAVDGNGQATVTMLLTDPGCVFFFEMGREIKERVSTIPGISSVRIESIGDRWWETERMTADARAKLARMRAHRDAGRQVPFRTPTTGG